MEISFINAGFQFPPIITNKDGEIYSLDFGGMLIATTFEISLVVRLFIKLMIE